MLLSDLLAALQGIESSSFRQEGQRFRVTSRTALEETTQARVEALLLVADFFVIVSSEKPRDDSDMLEKVHKLTSTFLILGLLGDSYRFQR